MTPKEKAEELVNKSKQYVHGYVGSSMLTNYEYPGQILSRARELSLIFIEEKLQTFYELCGNEKHMWKSHENGIHDNLQEVKTEINKL